MALIAEYDLLLDRALSNIYFTFKQMRSIICFCCRDKASDTNVNVSIHIETGNYTLSELETAINTKLYTASNASHTAHA
jgi:hypothetical protein